MSMSGLDAKMQKQGFFPSKVFAEGVEANSYVKLFSCLSDERVIVNKSGQTCPPEDLQDKIDIYIDNFRDILFYSENQFTLNDFLQAEKNIDYERFIKELYENIEDEKDYVIQTESGRSVGFWDGQSVSDLQLLLKDISKNMLDEHERIKMDELPRSDFVPEELMSYTGYPIWAVDKAGCALIGEDMTIVNKQMLGRIFRETDTEDHPMPEAKSLYQKLREIGAEMDNHESDLYVKDSKEVRDVIKQHQLENDGYPQVWSRFTDLETKQTWIEFPFAYDPYWEARISKKDQDDPDDDEGPTPGR